LHILHRELYFIPILLASFWFGLRFGLTTSVVVSLIYAPHVLLYNDPHSTGLTVSSHILVFNLVAIVLGWLVDREKGQRQEVLAKQAAEAYSKALEHELEKAREIQRDFLPDQIPQPPNWEIAAFFHPAIQVSGDFYDVFPLPGGNVGLVIADICDKGMGSALFMALFRSLIRVFSGQADLCELSNSAVDEKMGITIESQAVTHDQTNALKAVALINDYIAEEHCKTCMFATIFFGVLNPATGQLAYINGGHEPLFIVGPAGVKESLRATGPAVGILLDSEFEIRQIQLEPGDILIGYTDGVTEARSPSDELFTRKRLQSLLEEPAFSASDLLENIKIDLFTYTDTEPNSDDITMLAVRRASMEADILP
jgi:sigma-B regulation protein RsbU (phosphoserine phosphatase)